MGGRKMEEKKKVYKGEIEGVYMWSCRGVHKYLILDGERWGWMHVCLVMTEAEGRVRGTCRWLGEFGFR